MKRLLLFIIMLTMNLSLGRCPQEIISKEISADNDIVWMTEDGLSWFVCGSTYGKAFLNGIEYSEAVLANYKYGLVFSNYGSNALLFEYRVYDDYIKVTCTRDVDEEIGVGTEFIFYPHDRNEDTSMMAAWRESVDVKSNIMWMTADGTSWFIRSETREEALINGVCYSDLDTSNFPEELYLKRDGKYVVVLRCREYTEDFIMFYCNYDPNKEIGLDLKFTFYPHRTDE